MWYIIFYKDNQKVVKGPFDNENLCRRYGRAWRDDYDHSWYQACQKPDKYPNRQKPNWNPNPYLSTETDEVAGNPYDVYNM